jgi:hypothetical protein
MILSIIVPNWKRTGIRLDWRSLTRTDRDARASWRVAPPVLSESSAEGRLFATRWRYYYNSGALARFCSAVIPRFLKQLEGRRYAAKAICEIDIGVNAGAASSHEDCSIAIYPCE